MANSILRRLLGREAADATSSAESFSLPTALAPGSRVLLIASDDLCDLLFAMPFVEGLRIEVPGVQLGLVCDDATSQLALSGDRFDEVIVANLVDLTKGSASRRELEKILEAEPWDVAILLSRDPDLDRAELALSAGAKLRMGPGHERAFPSLNCEVRLPVDQGYPYGRTHIWGRLLGLKLEDLPLRWPIEEKRGRQMQQLVHFNKPRREQRLIGIDPSVGKSGGRISAASMGHIADHIASKVMSRWIVLCANEDGPWAEELLECMKQDPLDLPRPTLLERVLLLAQCDLFVCGNTDLMHFAAALGVPTLAFFTPADGDRWVPEQARRIEVVKPEAGADLNLGELMLRVETLLAD